MKLKLFITSSDNNIFEGKYFNVGESLMTIYTKWAADILSDNESVRFQKININSMKFLD